MQNNDLSNRTAPYIAFDIDSLLYVEVEEKNPLKRMLDLFLPASKRYVKRTYNTTFTNYLRHLYKTTDYNIVLLTTELEESQLEELAEKLDYEFIPFSNLYSYENEETLRAFCAGTFMYLFSSNEELVSRLSASNAMTFDRVGEVLR